MMKGDNEFMNDQITEPNGDAVDDPQNGHPEPQDQTTHQDPDGNEPDDSQGQPTEYDKLRNDIQSWMGRREKDMEERLMGGIADLLNQTQFQPNQPPATQQTDIQDDDPEPDYDFDPKGWTDWKLRQDKKTATQNIQWEQQTYQQTINHPKVRHPDDAIHEAVMNEMQHVKNVDPVTNQPMSPTQDAIYNYNAALRTVMEKTYQKNPGNDNPLNNNPIPSRGLGVSQPGTQEPNNPAMMPRNLSAASQKLVQRAGWNAEKVREVLGKKQNG